MLAPAILAGISYSDFWKMTISEIDDVLQAKHELVNAQARAEAQNSAFVAYWGGAYSRSNIKLPISVAQAFPNIFGMTSGGNIKAENWQDSEKAMLAIAANFKKQKGDNNGNR